MCFLKFSSKIGWFFVNDLIFMSLFTVQNLTNGCFGTNLNRFGSGQVWTGLVSKSLGNMPRGLCAYSSYGQYMSNVPPRFAQYMAKVWPRYAHVLDITKWHTMSPGRKWDKMSTGTKCRWDKMFPNHLCHPKKAVFGRNQSFRQNNWDPTTHVTASYRDKGTWNTQIQAQILVEIQIIKQGLRYLRNVIQIFLECAFT